MTAQPLVSVGLPVYNGERYLRFALDSLLAQDLQNFELIISDNGSTDATFDICEFYAKRDQRIRLYRSDSNRGATWNWRRVLELANGRYFKWAAHDDECYPSMLRRCVEAIQVRPDSIALAYPRFEFIDETGSVIRYFVGPEWDHVHTSASRPHLRLAHVLFRAITGIAEYGVMNMAFLRQTTPYGSIAADWVKLAELAMLGVIVEVPETLLRPRIHNSNSMATNSNWHQLLQWHDPEQRQAPLLPYDCAIILEYLRAIHALPLSPVNKMWCYAVACTTPPFRWSVRHFLRATGAARRGLQGVTGWRWLARGDSLA